MKRFGNGKSYVITKEGGFALYFINKTGAASVKGTIVSASTTTDDAVEIESADGIDPIGVIYKSGVADGDKVLVVISGKAEILLKDTIAATHGDWLGVSDVAGRAFSQANPPATIVHDREIGHSIESIAGGSDVLVTGVLHYR
jgi:hypothetical protein